MKAFISWSGDRSQALAHALSDWLPLVLHYVEPWLSETDVAAGDRWATVIAKELEASNFGIICVTPENAGAPWLLFEAGALAKSMQGARVIPLLFNLEFSDITGPLAQFHAKKTDRTGLSEVIHSINHGSDESISEDRAKQLFDRLWPSFEDALQLVPSVAPTEKHMRPQHEIIEELVTGIRGLDSRFRDLETAVSDREVSSPRRQRRFHPMMLDELSHMISDEPDDPFQLLFIAGMVREDLPWLSEVLHETYRDLRSGDEKRATRTIQRLSRLTHEMRRGRFEPMTMLMGDPRESHIWMMEFPRILDRLVHQFDVNPREDDIADDLPLPDGKQDLSLAAPRPSGS